MATNGGGLCIFDQCNASTTLVKYCELTMQKLTGRADSHNHYQAKEGRILAWVIGKRVAEMDILLWRLEKEKRRWMCIGYTDRPQHDTTLYQTYHVQKRIADVALGVKPIASVG
eukprot:Gb_40147 [translate_table: standard]